MHSDPSSPQPPVEPSAPAPTLVAGPAVGDATATLLSAPDPIAPSRPSYALDTPTPDAVRPPSMVFLTVVTVISLAADLVSKGWAKGHLSGRGNPVRRYEVIKGSVDFIFAQNPGGAWSFLRSLPDGLRRPFFLVVSAAAIVFIISIYRRIHPNQWAMRWGLPLALGGAMGNLVDRIRYGWVVDFIDFYVSRGGREHHWPTFNVADIAIVVGVGLMAIDMMRSSRTAKAPVSAPVPPIA
jgi:signal peptidase II